jgi:hypothetical protein
MTTSQNTDSRKAQVTANVPEWVRESILILAERRKASVSEVIATAIYTYLKTTKK